MSDAAAEELAMRRTFADPAPRRSLNTSGYVAVRHHSSACSRSYSTHVGARGAPTASRAYFWAILSSKCQHVSEEGKTYVPARSAALMTDRAASCSEGLVCTQFQSSASQSRSCPMTAEDRQSIVTTSQPTSFARRSHRSEKLPALRWIAIRAGMVESLWRSRMVHGGRTRCQGATPVLGAVGNSTISMYSRTVRAPWPCDTLEPTISADAENLRSAAQGSLRRDCESCE